MLIYRAMDYSGFKTIYVTYVHVCIQLVDWISTCDASREFNVIRWALLAEVATTVCNILQLHLRQGGMKRLLEYVLRSNDMSAQIYHLRQHITCEERFFFCEVTCEEKVN
jgi:hypothetical protein